MTIVFTRDIIKAPPRHLRCLSVSRLSRSYLYATLTANYKLFNLVIVCLTGKAPKKQMTKLRLQNFEKDNRNCIMLKSQRLEGNSVDPDEKAHYVQPHLDLQYLQIQLLLCLALYGLTSDKFFSENVSVQS